MKILNVKFSRNGSGTAEPFFKVLFEDKTTAKEWEPGICGNIFVATFKTEGEPETIIRDSIRIINLKNFELNFYPEEAARLLELEALTRYCTAQGTKQISWSAAAYPDQYEKKAKSTRRNSATKANFLTAI